MYSFSSLLSRPVSFLSRQHRDWKVTVVRTAIDRFSYQMIYPYLSIYIIALGASATQLGMVNSVGMIIGGVLSPLMGWLIDRIGPKKIYLLGIGFVVISYLTFAISHNWMMTIVAMITYWVGFSISSTSCATICGNCLSSPDRALGMTFCETFAAGILGMAGPLLGAWLVGSSGGVNVDGIRPVFFVALVASVASFFIVFSLLSGRKWTIKSAARSSFIQDFRDVLKGGKNLKRWLVISAFSSMPLGMILPFSQVFAHEIKGADQYVLGAMVTGYAIAPIIFSMPLGRLADRLGRKMSLYITIPLFWVSNLLLVWAPGPTFLIVAGVLQGFYYIIISLIQTIEREMVSADRMGRWLGTARFFRMILSACMASIAGVIWDKLGPQYVFLIYVALDLVIRMPLLISMPETLRQARSLPRT